MINTLIFDLGVVLIHLHPERGIQKLLRAAPNHSEETLSDFFRQAPHFDAYETGEIDSETFFYNTCSQLNLTMPFQDFKEIWTSIFSENVHMTCHLADLKKKYTLILLSNTNPMHAEYCISHYPFLKLFDHLVFSFEEKSMKPDEQIYRAALRFCGKPETALFIDDKQINIDGAANCGMRAIRYDNPQSCVSSMRAAGVNIPDQK